MDAARSPGAPARASTPSSTPAPKTSTPSTTCPAPSTGPRWTTPSASPSARCTSRSTPSRPRSAAPRCRRATSPPTSSARCSTSPRLAPAGVLLARRQSQRGAGHHPRRHRLSGHADRRRLQGLARRAGGRAAGLARALHYRVVCGPTGSGKTRLLQALAIQGAQVLDLEALANHRSSVLGHLPGVPQPSQKAFDTLIWAALRGLEPGRARCSWKAKARKSAMCACPIALIDAMRSEPVHRSAAERR
jgi:hypothetical protein